MHAPENTAVEGSADAPRKRRGAAAQALTLVLLFGSAGAVLLAASPSLLSLAGLTKSQAAEPRFFAPPRGILEGDESLPPDFEDEVDRDVSGDALDDLPLGAALESVKLVDSPSGAATITGELVRGDIVRVVKQQGEWALVLKSGGDTIAMGWTRRSTLAIR